MTEWGEGSRLRGHDGVGFGRGDRLNLHRILALHIKPTLDVILALHIKPTLNVILALHINPTLDVIPAKAGTHARRR